MQSLPKHRRAKCGKTWSKLGRTLQDRKSRSTRFLRDSQHARRKNFENLERNASQKILSQNEPLHSYRTTRRLDLHKEYVGSLSKDEFSCPPSLKRGGVGTYTCILSISKYLTTPSIFLELFNQANHLHPQIIFES